jgi:hypothetical protein
MFEYLLEGNEECRTNEIRAHVTSGHTNHFLLPFLAKYFFDIHMEVRQLIHTENFKFRKIVEDNYSLTAIYFTY